MTANYSGTDDARFGIGAAAGAILASLGCVVLMAVAGWFGWGEGGFAVWHASATWAVFAGSGAVFGGLLMMLRLGR